MIYLGITFNVLTLIENAGTAVGGLFGILGASSFAVFAKYSTIGLISAGLGIALFLLVNSVEHVFRKENVSV